MRITTGKQSEYIQNTISYWVCEICGASVMGPDWMALGANIELHQSWHKENK